MSEFDPFSHELERLQALGLLRVPDDGSAWAQVKAAAAGGGVEPINASSNDYLGLARREVSRETLLACAGSRPGAGASRLIHGTVPEHLHLEEELSRWVGLPAALGFTSGFAANFGLLSSLGMAGDRILSDQLNHASLIDGCRFGRGPVEVFPHLDCDALRKMLSTPFPGRTWVVTESYFSMDGDGPRLEVLRELCDRHGASLIVDEAHALGVFGEDGGGRCRQAGVAPDILVGTLGKAVGVQGAFVAGSPSLRAWLWNKARSFVFSTGTSPVLARLALQNVITARQMREARDALQRQSQRVREKLRSRGVPTVRGSFGPIIPVLLGDNARALAASERLRARGILSQAIRPPTVPTGTARLRITLSAALSDAQVDRLGEELATVCS